MSRIRFGNLVSKMGANEVSIARPLAVVVLGIIRGARCKPDYHNLGL